MANCLIFHNLCSLTRLVRNLEQRGESVPEDALAAISPYLTEHINRFGDYTLNLDRTPPTRLWIHLKAFLCNRLRTNGPFCRESLPYPVNSHHMRGGYCLVALRRSADTTPNNSESNSSYPRVTKSKRKRQS